MARGKKKNLSLEELLEEALVKEEDKPYEVPENWVWTRLGNISKIIGGGTPSSRVIEYYDNGLIPWICPSDLSSYDKVYISKGRRNITQLGLEKSSAKLIPKDTVLLSSRAPIGYVVIAKNKLCTNQGFKSFLPSKTYMPKYLLYYLKSIKHLLESYASGTTFLELSGNKAGLIEIPIAPLAEQQRIVDTIESLFEKLDKAKELVQNALNSFENRKAAILHKAFTGELTAKWREENGVNLDDWEDITLEKITTLMQNGISKRNGKDGGMTVVLRLANIKNNTIDTSDLRSILLNEKEIDRYSLDVDDILIIRVNGSVDNVGKMISIDNEEKWAFCDHLIKLKVIKDLVLPQFLIYKSMTDSYRYFVKLNMVSSAGQNTISQKSLKKFVISIPNIEEQKKIVSILNNLLDKESTANELSDVIEKIALMKKSILARAFRGELDTNNPEEESAIELLKEVLAEKNKKTTNNEKKAKKINKSKISKNIINNIQDLLIQILIQEKNSITPERLFELANIDDRYEFYSEIKALLELGKVKEIKDKKTSISLLEVVK